MQDFTNEKAILEQIAPKPDEIFSNEDLETRLVAFQNAISNAIFSTGMSEKIRPQDLTMFLDRLARDNGVERDETFCRLSENMRCLGQQIGGLKKGVKGEERTKLGLRNLEFLPNVKILYNVTLGTDPADRTEYDAIVLTAYGIFVIESKNYSGDAHLTEKGILHRVDNTMPDFNLGEKMNRKQFLLRSCLGRYSALPYYSMLLYVNEEANLIDDYHQIPIVYCSTVSDRIIQHLTGEELATPDELEEIKSLINSQKVEAKYPCRVKCQEIIDDLTNVLTRIANTKQTACAQAASMPAHQNRYTPVAKPKLRVSKWVKSAAKVVVIIFTGAVSGYYGAQIYVHTHFNK